MNINILEFLNETLKGTKVTEFTIKRGNDTILIKRSPDDILKVRKKEEDKKIKKEKAKAKDSLKDEMEDKGEEKTIQVLSKAVGVFYRGKTKIAAPLVKEGSEVKTGDQLGIINCMGVIEKIVSPADGTIREILATNHKAVEYGQPLYVIQIME